MIEILIVVLGVSFFSTLLALPLLVLWNMVEERKAYTGPRAEPGVVVPMLNFHVQEGIIPMFNFNYGKPQTPMFNFYHGKG